MDKKNKINYRIIFAATIIILIVILIIFGYKSMNNYISSKKKENNAEEKINYPTKVAYEGKLYTLPATVKYRENYKEADIEKLNIYHVGETNWNAVVNILNISTLGINSDILQDYTALEAELLEEGWDVRDSRIIQYGNTSVVVFHFYYNLMKGLFVYMPAYDDYWYAIRFTSGKGINEEEEMYFDYDILGTVVDILNTAE